MLCSFCRADRDHVFLSGTPGIGICVSCAETDPCIPRAIQATAICSFCRKTERISLFPFRRRHIALVNDSGDARICSVCMRNLHQALMYTIRTGKRMASNWE